MKPEDVKSRGGKQRGAAVRPPVFDGHDHLDDPKARLAVAGLAVTVAVFVMLATAYEGGADALDYALVAVGSLALAAFGRVPRIVLAVTTACMVAFVLHAEPTTAAAFPVLGAVHIAAHGRHRLLAAGTGLAFLGAFFAADPGGDGAVERTLLLTGWFVCAAAMGVAAKTWQAYVHQTEERALEAERTREEAALRRAGEERLRIARELHDSLTHSISIVKLQAGVAVHLARKRGEEVPPALLAIQEASGEAMRELRATLEVLRTDAPAGSPALLVERARSAGLPVELTVTGRERALPPELELGVYRIVQESLTNAARHAVGAESVGVHLDYGERQVVVRVDDDGVARPGGALAHGVGLTGMRERVEALGGALRAGARDEGGFSVRAELPVDSPGAPVEAQGAWETQG
ncbi:two-component sensor histidine kinase [Streptomyces lasiicapitis]|uniref:histidine kinase n=2 Tax=Streptomyces TaxID=1883 RepID=A0ABQ2N1C5_9ACTN|nr:two-component sensor histidine kinase [Streptomyces lasiicapitis]